MNSQVPLARLLEFEGNGIVGRVNEVFWSFCGFIPSAARFADAALPRLIERVRRYNVQAALLIPASRLCHQTMGLAARALEAAGITTMMLAVDREAADRVRAAARRLLPGELRPRRGRAELARTPTPHPRRSPPPP